MRNLLFHSTYLKFIYSHTGEVKAVANRIKGITVEIGGDTTGLDKALKNVNSSRGWFPGSAPPFPACIRL